MTQRIRIYKGAAVVYEEGIDKKGVTISTNTGEAVDDVAATSSNIKKYIEEKKYPGHEKGK